MKPLGFLKRTDAPQTVKPQVHKGPRTFTSWMSRLRGARAAESSSVTHAKQASIFSDANKALTQSGPSARLSRTTGRHGSWVQQTIDSPAFKKQTAVMREARIMGLEMRQKHLNGEVWASVRDRFLDKVQEQVAKSEDSANELLRAASDKALNETLAKGDIRTLDRALNRLGLDVFAARNADLQAGAGRSEKTIILMRHELELRKARLDVTRDALPKADPDELKKQSDLVNLSRDTLNVLGTEKDVKTQERLLDLLLRIGEEIDSAAHRILHESGALHPLQ